jgi:hypothetical protein
MPDRAAQQRKLVVLRQRITRLNQLIQKYKQLKNTLNNSFLTVTRVNTNRYSRPKNYKVLLQRYINRVQGRRSHNNNNDNNNNNNNSLVYGRRYR